MASATPVAALVNYTGAEIKSRGEMIQARRSVFLGGRRTILAMLRRNTDLAPALRLYALLAAAIGIPMLAAVGFEEQT